MTTIGFLIVVAAMAGAVVTAIFGMATVRYDRTQEVLNLVWHGWMAVAVVGFAIVIFGLVLG